jgi:hypothetical protein
MRSAARCSLTVGAVKSRCMCLTKAATWKGCTSVSWAMPHRSHQTAKRRVAFMYALRGVVVVDLGSEEFEDALGGFGRRGRGREKHGGGRGRG